MKTILLKTVIGLIVLANLSFAQTNKNAGANFKNPFNQKTSIKQRNQAQSSVFLKKKNDYQKSDNSYFFDFSNSNSAVNRNAQSITKENFFQLYSGELRMRKNDDFFQFTKTEKDELGFTHHFYKQYYKNVLVYGSGFSIREKSGKIQKASGKFFSDLNINTNPTITEQNVIQKAQQALTGAGYSNDVPSLVIAPKSGIYKTENFKLCYKIKVTTNEPYQIYDVFIDAHTGEIVNKISKIAHGDVVGSGSTLYSGTKSFTADSYGGSYRLRETGRPIQTFDMMNDKQPNFANAIDFTDSDNSWTEQSYTLETITISSISQSWWYNSIADQTPDLYLIVKDGSSNTVLQTNNKNDQNPPAVFTLKLKLTNPPYTFELWDYDAASSDDFGGTYSINTTIGTNNFSGNGNNGSYQITGQNNPALDGHWGMEQVYDYYLNEHSRNSFDGSGSIIKSYVHYDNGLANAFWDGQRMCFGDGDGTTEGAQTALDVCGHELTHAVVQHNGGGGLDYQGESGALNESFADIFGTAVEFYAMPGSANWLFSENTFITAGDYTRSLLDPHSKSQPDTYGSNDSYWTDPTNVSEPNDWGGVHTNSGVQNYWFYLLSVGGSGTNENGDIYSVTGIGIDKAKRIAYRNLTTPPITNSMSSNYLDSYYGSIQATEDLYGNGSTEYWAVINAWYAVGIGSTSNGYCGGTTDLTESSGTFTDGSGTADYQDNSDCMWLIKPSGANSITLNFTAFNTELNYDGVIVYDGPDTNSTVLGTFTGTSIPSSVTSSGGAMLVWFISDNTTTASGWSASYTSTGTAYCDGLTVLSSSTGSFTDGSSTNNYGNNSECYWYIAPPGAASITLSFSAFNTELNYDGIAVYDDISGTNLLGTYTGTSIPSSVTSNTGAMLVVFISDYITTAAGFNASYTSTGTPYCSGTTTLTTDFATINDGSGTNNYYNNSNCNYLIQPTGATSITLTFTDFNIEQPSSDGNTIFDYVEVFDGTNTSAPSLGKFAGSNIPPSVTSTGGSMFVNFSSDLSVNESGWDAYYLSTTNTFCSGNTPLTATSGTITDGSSSNQYGNNSDCSWLIQPTNANSITLTFTAFDTELNYDGIIIYDGADTSSNILATYTGSSIPSAVTSTGGAMFIWFLSDGAVRQNGWSANYTSNISTGITETFSSKHFKIYPNPNNGKFEMYLDNSNAGKREVQIYNPIGQLVWSNLHLQPKRKYDIDLSSLDNGVYFVFVKSDNGIETTKIIINK